MSKKRYVILERSLSSKCKRGAFPTESTHQSGLPISAWIVNLEERPVRVVSLCMHWDDWRLSVTSVMYASFWTLQRPMCAAGVVSNKYIIYSFCLFTPSRGQHHWFLFMNYQLCCSRQNKIFSIKSFMFSKMLSEKSWQIINLITNSQ